MAVANLSIFGSAFITPVLVGKITREMGWPWTFYFVTIFSGVLLPFVVLFVPETAYPRSALLNTDVASTDHPSARQHPKSSVELSGGDDVAFRNAVFDGSLSTEEAHPNNLPRRQLPEKVSFARSLLPFNGRKTNESFFKLLLRPFPLFFHPAIFWVSLAISASPFTPF